jgi:hypothetical protein
MRTTLIVAKWLMLLPVSLALYSCGKQSAAGAAQPVSPVRYQRFVPVPRQPENVQGVPWSGSFALDTKTGHLCLTYPGDFSEQWRHDVPMCYELFDRYPDAP